MGTRKQYKANKAAYAARQEKQREALKKQPWWFNQPLPIDRFTGWLMIYTFVLAIATIASAVILWRTDLTLFETLVRNERPWISVEIVPISPLDFEDGSAALDVKFVLKNFGKTPAIAVLIEGDMILTSVSLFKQKRMCDRPDMDNNVGHTVFPNEAFEQEMQYTIRAGDIEAELEYIEELQRRSGFYRDDGDKIIYPMIIGCISYRFPLGPPNEFHQTGVVANVYRKNPAIPKQGLAVRVKQDIPMEDVLLDRTKSLGNDAN